VTQQLTAGTEEQQSTRNNNNEIQHLNTLAISLFFHSNSWIQNLKKLIKRQNNKKNKNTAQNFKPLKMERWRLRLATWSVIKDQLS